MGRPSPSSRMRAMRLNGVRATGTCSLVTYASGARPFCSTSGEQASHLPPCIIREAPTKNPVYLHCLDSRPRSVCYTASCAEKKLAAPWGSAEAHGIFSTSGRAGAKKKKLGIRHCQAFQRSLIGLGVQRCVYIRPNVWTGWMNTGKQRRIATTHNPAVPCNTPAGAGWLPPALDINDMDDLSAVGEVDEVP